MANTPRLRDNPLRPNIAQEPSSLGQAFETGGAATHDSVACMTFLWAARHLMAGAITRVSTSVGATPSIKARVRACRETRGASTTARDGANAAH